MSMFILQGINVIFKIILCEKNLFRLKNIYYGQNNFVKPTLKMIIHVLTVLQKRFECFTSKHNARGTF